MTDIVTIPSSGTWSDIAAAINHNTAEGLDKTNIQLSSGNAASTGAVTINKPTGRVLFITGGTSITVTNSLVTANSNLFATVLEADTATIKNVIPAAGSFDIVLSAGASSELTVCFMVVNPAT